MKNNKFFLAVIAGAVTIFLLGFLTYGMMLRDILHAQMLNDIEREMPKFWMMIIAQVIWAYFLTTNFSRWSDISTASAGAMRGATIAFLTAVSIDLVWYSHSYVMSKWGVMIDVITWTVINAIAGAVIGKVLGMGKKPQTAS